MSSSSTTSTSSSLVVPSFSSKVKHTLDPCVVLMKQLSGKYEHLWKDKGGIYSLAQGVVYWEPPEESTQAMKNALDNNSCSLVKNLHMYGPDEGLAELRHELERKIHRENGLTHHDVMVTVGANQAYVNCVITLLDDDDDGDDGEKNKKKKSVVFAPYYFNHVMAMQMTVPDSLLVGPCNSDGQPDVDWLQAQFEGVHDDDGVNTGKIHMVTIVNPGNPTGVALSRSFLQRVVDLCRQHQCWLVLDCTYEYFVATSSSSAPASSSLEEDKEDSDTSWLFDGCFDKEPHVIHIFSFSKSYALAGYRCGYLAISRDALGLYDQMLKVQDTIPIAPSRISQVAALGALGAGPKWVRQRFQTLDKGREAIRRALEPLPQLMGGTGAMYIMAKLPEAFPDDQHVAQNLVRDFGIAVIPGSFCGFPGWIRVCYSNLPPEKCLQAADRLAQGIRSLLDASS